VCSAETNVLSSHNVRAAPAAPSNVMACGGEEVDITVHYNSDAFVTICGTNFCDDGVSVEVVGGFKADVVSQSDSMVIAQLPSNGAGQHLKLKLFKDSFVTLIPDIFVSYDQPIVSGVVADQSAKRSTVATQHVIIYGANFGDPSPLIHVSASIGGFPCLTLNHVSRNEIRCAVTGWGANAGVTVTVNGQSSVPNTNAVGAATVRFDFANSATPGLDCVPPFGSADAINSEYCNCWSGSAPSDNLLSTDCEVHAACAGRVTSQPTVAQSAPQRPVTEFKDDKLWIKQVSQIVKNRRDTIIQFVVPQLNGFASPSTPAGTVSSSSCNYPGSLWAKKLNNLDCLDEYYGSLPWSQHELCGFVEKTDATTVSSLMRVWVSNLVTSYTETYKNTDGTVNFRKISHAYLVTVSFVRQVKVLTQTPVSVWIADQNSPASITIEIVGDAMYDVASKETIINFVTTMVWPYQVDNVELPGTWFKDISNNDPGKVAVRADLSTIQPGQLNCDQTEDTTCEQSWVMTIQTAAFAGFADTCNIKGKFEFNTAPLICRDYTNTDACSGSPSTNFTIIVGPTDLCDAHSKDIDASAGLSTGIETYYDADLTVPQSIFQTGDMVYFKLSVVDPSSTIDQITFNTIRVYTTADSSIEDALYATLAPGDDVAQATTFNLDAQFNITQEFRSPFLRPGDEGDLNFNFRLLRKHLQVISALSTVSSDAMTQQITVEAVIDILYHGNQKRTFVATSNIPALTHTQISFYDMGEDEVDLEPHANDAATVDAAQGSLFSASPASAVVASCVAVVAAAAVILA
jgi:hypothetical protein